MALLCAALTNKWWNCQMAALKRHQELPLLLLLPAAGQVWLLGQIQTGRQPRSGKRLLCCCICPSAETDCGSRYCK